jgi:hypothetical protein
MLRVFVIQVRSYKRVLRMCGTKKAVDYRFFPFTNCS